MTLEMDAEVSRGACHTCTLTRNGPQNLYLCTYMHAHVYTATHILSSTESAPYDSW